MLTLITIKIIIIIKMRNETSVRSYLPATESVAAVEGQTASGP